jgi:hypothetical protein
VESPNPTLRFECRLVLIESEKNQNEQNTFLAIKLDGQDWVVAVFKCKQQNLRKILADFYGFVQDLESVRSLHFLIRDRLADKAVFSFRIMVDSEGKSIVASKVAYKLGTFLSKGDFAVNPEKRNSLAKYVAWDPEERLAKIGPKKFIQFCKVLEKMSELTLWMIKKEHFSSDKRVEAAHVMSWMLGCTEYGLLDTKHWEVGYYDRIEDKYCRYLTHEFPEK